MNVVIFCGPTISPHEVRNILPDALILPPASQGDVYLSLKAKPSVLGIIDGYFQQVPSVWHKEILWALHKGVRVYGAASMGALRAAELHEFGMIGIGKIFEDYKSGVLEDDDEVAVLHGPPETGYLACSVAMVDIRWTLSAAVEAGVIAPELACQVIAHTKSLHYTQRSFDRILPPARRMTPAYRRLIAWLPHGRVRQKKNDAIALCGAIQQLSPTASPPASTFEFEETLHWRRLVESLERGL